MYGTMHTEKVDGNSAVPVRVRWTNNFCPQTVEKKEQQIPAIE